MHSLVRSRLARRAVPLALAVLSALTTRSIAEITPEARAVVNRYLDATGGAAAFQAIHSTRSSAKVAAFGLTGTTQTWTRHPDWRASQTELGPLKILEGYDGKIAWRTDPTSGKLVLLDGKDLESARASAYFDNEVWLDADQGGGKVALAGTEKDSLGAYSVLEVTPPVGRTRRFYVNQKTGLVDRGTTKQDQMDITNTLSDYRSMAGRLVPFAQLTQIAGMSANDLHVTLDSVWVNETIPDSRFQPPASEAAAIQYLKTPGLAQLPFHYLGRHVWLRASVNGGPPADFLYDTGASVTVIDSAYAAKLGLETHGNMQGQGAGATGRASFGQIQSLSVAGPDGDGIIVHDQRVAVLSVNGVLAPFFWQDCAGIVGYDVISRFVNEIDYDQERLTLHDPKTFTYGGSGAVLPIELAGTVPTVEMTLDGEYKGRFRIDVGSGSTVDLHGPFVKKYDLSKKAGPSLAVTGGGFGGLFTSKLTRMHKLQIGPYSWEKPLVLLSGAEVGAFASEDYAGNIGNQILERFRVILDYDKRTLTLEPGKRLENPDRFTRAGVQLARYGEVVRAMQVIPGSPADKAGIKEGDRVFSVDGKSVSALDPNDLEEVFDRGAVGRKVAVEIEHDGKKKTATLKLAEII